MLRVPRWIAVPPVCVALTVLPACEGPGGGAGHTQIEPSEVTSGTINGEHYDLVVVEGANGLCVELHYKSAGANSGFCPGSSEHEPTAPDFGMAGPAPSLTADVAYGLGPTAAVTVQLREVGDGGRFVGSPVLYPVHPLPRWVGHGTWWGPCLEPSGSGRLVEKFLDKAGNPVPVESFLS